jgi:hypothetical protein
MLATFSTETTISSTNTSAVQETREGSNEELLALVEKHAGHTLHRNHYLLLGVKEH